MTNSSSKSRATRSWSRLKRRQLWRTRKTWSRRWRLWPKRPNRTLNPSICSRKLKAYRRKDLTPGLKKPCLTRGREGWKTTPCSNSTQTFKSCKVKIHRLCGILTGGSRRLSTGLYKSKSLMNWRGRLTNCSRKLRKSYRCLKLVVSWKMHLNALFLGSLGRISRNFRSCISIRI